MQKKKMRNFRRCWHADRGNLTFFWSGRGTILLVEPLLLTEVELKRHAFVVTRACIIRDEGSYDSALAF